jgi:hypothetical protein
MPSPAQPPPPSSRRCRKRPQPFAPPVGDEGIVAAGPERNDVEQFQQVDPPMPDAPVASPYPNAYPGSPYIGANISNGPYGGNAAAAAAAGVTAAPPETQFDYANPQKYFEQRRLQQQAQQPTSVPTAVPSVGTPIRGDGADAGCAAQRRPDRAGRAPAAGRQPGAAGRADAGPGRVLQPVQPPGRLGAAAGGAGQHRDAGRTGSRQVRQPVQPVAAARVTPSDVSGEYAERGDYHRAPDRAWDYLPTVPRQAGARARLAERAARRYAVLDAGCGEGRPRSRSSPAASAIEGVDANYTSRPRPARIAAGAAVPDGRFARALCLDVLEHLAYEDQPKALSELHRVLAPAASCWSRCRTSRTCSRASTSC